MLVAVVCMKSKKKVVNDSLCMKVHLSQPLVCVLTSSVRCAWFRSDYRSVEDEVRGTIIAGLFASVVEN